MMKSLKPKNPRDISINAGLGKLVKFTSIEGFRHLRFANS
jgi:hypothetical protein